MILPMKLRTPPASALLAKAGGLPSGGGRPGSDAPVAKLVREQLREIARVKLPDLNTTDLDAADGIVAGTARSMGIEWSMFQDPEGIRYPWVRTTEVTGSGRPCHGLHPRQPGHAGQPEAGRPVPSLCTDGQRPRSSRGSKDETHPHPPAKQQRERRWRQVLPGCATRPRDRSSAASPRQRRPKEVIRKVIVSEFLSLEGPCQPGQAERRNDQTGSSTAAEPLPCFEDAGGALEGSNPTLVERRFR
jgi:hypothetical protein